MPRITWRAATAAAIVTALTVTTGALLLTHTAPQPGQVVTGRVDGTAAGTVDYNVYLPPGYDSGDDRYPVVYLLHGRGDTSAAWPRVASDLDELINAADHRGHAGRSLERPWLLVHRFAVHG